MASAVPQLPVPHADLVKHIAKHPETPLIQLIEPYRKFEAHLRQTFAQDAGNELLKDPHVNVLPIFTEDTANVKIKARNLDAESEEEKAKYIMPLTDDVRREDGSPAVVSSLKEFQRNFGIFSESSLGELDWSNVVAAGSSVVNCLLPVPEKYSRTKRGLREFYHEKFSPASDVDLFLYGLTEEQAIEKIKDIETKVRDSLLTETTTVRTKHAITICSQYPTRHIQIVLRIYNSVSEILTGFDIDCSGAAYNGKQVYCTPRALQSYMTQINHIDLSRRSPSYENRLSKYSHRGFEVYWPDLDRSRIDPSIFERSFQRTLGLARLLVLERLPTSRSRESYIDKRREERGRPAIDRYNRFFRSLGGNIKDNHEDEVADWVNEEEVSNYHTFTIPYGEKFHAKKIEKLCYTRDLLLNAEWNQSDDREVYLHRHPAFFGRVEDVITDCCGYCPIPKTDEEKEIAEKESKIYVSGTISFIRDDPGRQQIGSFNPLTDDDWTEMAYVGNTARLCAAIVDGDLEHVEDWLAQEGVNPDTRDFTGRTPLHLAVMSSTPEIVKRIVDAGARLVARLADGRTALHLAAARGNVEIIKILMDKSIANEAEYEEKQDQRRLAKSSEKKAEGAAANEEDEGMADADEEESGEGSDEESDIEMVDGDESEVEARSMATGSFVEVKRQGTAAEGDEAALDDEEEPNFFDVNVVAWDTPCSALHLAITEGHDEVVKTLCQDYGADILLPVKFLDSQKTPSGSLLTLVLALALPEEKAKSMAKTLLSLGATSAQADLNSATAFHRYVEANVKSLIDTLLEADPTGAKSAINHVIVSRYGSPQTVLHAAIRQCDLPLVLTLLEHGAATEIDFETWLKSAKQSPMSGDLRSFEENEKRFKNSMEQPLIVALNSAKPETALLLLERGADPNVITASSYYTMDCSWSSSPGESALDLVTNQLEVLRTFRGENPETAPVKPEGIDTYLERFKEGTYQHWKVSNDVSSTLSVYRRDVRKWKRNQKNPKVDPGVAKKAEAIKGAIDALEKVEQVMHAKGAKTFGELFPDYRDKYSRNDNYHYQRYQSPDFTRKTAPYEFVFSFRSVNDVTKARHAAYLELFEATWSGDLDKIKSLTLGAWDEEKTEAPLKIAVTDAHDNSPFSLAFLRGHYDVAKAILEITQAQYSPREKPKTRFRMEDDDEDEDEYSDEDSCGDSNDSHPRIQSQIVGGDFTIENVGQVSLKVDSHTTPLEVLGWKCKGFREDGGPSWDTCNLFERVIGSDDLKGLKFLLDLAEHYSGQKVDPEEEVSSFYSFPIDAFNAAIRLGRIDLIAEVIKRTGAGLPLEHLVKDSGIELKEKPRYYQGLTVYGKKRSDWATAGREVVRRSTGSEVSPLLLAAANGSFESVEWFMTDIPLRLYLDFATSKRARDDTRLKHLAQAPGGIEKVISKWLSDQNDLVLHVAITASPSDRSMRLVTHLVNTFPKLVNAKSVEQKTPLMLACEFGRVEIAELLLKSGADPALKDRYCKNLLHTALQYSPVTKDLKRLLALFDRTLLAKMLRERTSLDQNGHTPIHSFISEISGWHWSSDDDKKKALEIVKLLLEISPEDSLRALRMLDAAGDTPLHSLILRDKDLCLDLARIIIDLDPSLLFRENAVGRTPVEVSRDRLLALKIKNPGLNNSFPNREVAGWPRRTYGWDTEESNSKPVVERMWQLCEETLAKFPTLPKRQLVSLHEANDVAKRLGEEHSWARYQFRISSPSPSEADGENAKEAEVVMDMEEKPEKKERLSDVISSRSLRVGHPWQAWPEEKVVENSSESD